MATVIIPLPNEDFDPSEVAISWWVLTRLGHKIVFATPEGEKAHADRVLLYGQLGFWNFLLGPRDDAVMAYKNMSLSDDFCNPISYRQIEKRDFDGALLPGGHAKGMRPYLESGEVQKLVLKMFKSNRPIAAICHGVLVVARTLDPETGKSVLYGKKTTGLPRFSERLAYRLTRGKMGDYYLTYPQTTVEDEVGEYLASINDFRQGPAMIFKDSPITKWLGFTVRDGNYLSARWPGDAYRFATTLSGMLNGK